MAKIKVTAYRDGGKYYDESITTLEDYPSIHNSPDHTTVKELKDLQVGYCYELMRKITQGYYEEFSPVISGWQGYFFVIEGLFEDNEYGFLTRLMDKT